MKSECDLADRECVPCKGGIPPLKGEELNRLHEKLGNGWVVVDDHHLEKSFSFNDFRSAMDFTLRVGELAESEIRFFTRWIPSESVTRIPYGPSWARHFLTVVYWQSNRSMKPPFTRTFRTSTPVHHFR